MKQIKVTNKDIDEALQKTMEQLGGKDRLIEALKANDVSVKEFKEDLKVQVKMQKLANSAGKIEVTDKECEKFLTENLISFDINYFNKKQFLTEIKLTENYINFIPKKNYKSSWMLPYLERHINRNKEKT